jgi:GTP-binding protein Era
MSEGPARCGVIAVIGAPNAGKSSLVNAFVGAKVSIVTPKVQTTRALVRGVAMDGATQLVFIDTPGIFTPRRRLDRAMVAAAFQALEGADAILLVVDAPSLIAARTNDKASAAARRAAEDTDKIVAALKDRELKALLVLNKVDSLSKRNLLPLAQSLNEAGVFEDVFFVSAKDGDGINDLKRRLCDRAPRGPYLYPEDQLSDISERLMAAEATREKLYLRLHDELPYEAMVETTKWERTKKNELRIEQTVFVARESHRPIVLGKGGQTLKAIGSAARAEIAELVGEPVHLFLEVKVNEKWADDPARYRLMGLGFVE